MFGCSIFRIETYYIDDYKDQGCWKVKGKPVCSYETQMEAAIDCIAKLATSLGKEKDKKRSKEIQRAAEHVASAMQDFKTEYMSLRAAAIHGLRDCAGTVVAGNTRPGSREC